MLWVRRVRSQNLRRNLFAEQSPNAPLFSISGLLLPTGFPNQGWMQLNGFLTNDTGKHAKTQLGLSLTVPWRWRSGSTQDRDRGMLPKILHVLGVGGYDKSRLKNIQSRLSKGSAAWPFAAFTQRGDHLFSQALYMHIMQEDNPLHRVVRHLL